MAGTQASGTHNKTDAQLKQLAIWAFDAYKVAVGGKAFDGSELGNWEQMDGRAQKGWIAAVDAILKKQDEVLHRDTAIKRF